jgi:uncharacterized membrane protein
MRNFRETNTKFGNSAILNPFLRNVVNNSRNFVKTFCQNFSVVEFSWPVDYFYSLPNFTNVNHFILLQLNTIQLVLASDGTASFRDDAQLRPSCHNLSIAQPFTTVTIYYTLSEPFQMFHSFSQLFITFHLCTLSQTFKSFSNLSHHNTSLHNILLAGLSFISLSQISPFFFKTFTDPHSFSLNQEPIIADLNRYMYSTIFHSVNL